MRIIYLFCLLFSCFLTTYNFGQDDTSQPLKVAVLAPLYLDSAFSGNTYKLSENSIPQYILTGLDFYNGVTLAIDSLQKEGVNMLVSIIDTKKKGTTINSILNEMSLANYSLIIASFNNINEQKQVSAFSFKNNIPVISVTYPNDASITANPFFIILNSTIKTHVDGIYKYVHENYANSKIVFITRTGYLEDKIAGDFKANDTGSNNLKYRLLKLPGTFSPSAITLALDNAKHNVVICGSLNEAFSVNVVKALNAATTYNTTVIGMPNWDGFRKLYQPENNSIEIIYSTPFHYSRKDSFETSLITAYKNVYAGRPSDMFFKGYEAMYHFSHLLDKYRKDIINHLSDTSYKVSNDFIIRPVKLSKQSFFPDYLENKNLYFIKKLEGETAAITQLSR